MTRYLARSRSDGDTGAAMILVIGTSVMVTTLIVTGMMIAMNSMAQSRNRQHFEQSLAAAENGIDWGLAKIQSAFDYYNKDYPVPSPPSDVDAAPTCNAATVSWPSSAPNGLFATEAAERDWARAELQTIAGISGCLQQGGEGEFAVLKPPTPLVNGQYPKYGKVYSLSWVPSRADASATTRLVKAEYVFMPYRPTHAVLTGGPLNVDSSTTVQGAYGVDPALASVHSNQTVSTNGNPTVYGPVTSTSTSSSNSNRFYANPGGAVSTTTLQKVPRVDAASFYTHVPGEDAAAIANWRDLCPDGSIRPYSANGKACESATILNPGPAASPTSYSLPFLGWEYDSGDRLWSATRDAATGTWFAHQANVSTKNGPDPQFANFTVIASAVNASDCATKMYGNIEWDHHSIKAPAFRNLWMFADSDIVTTSNFTAGSGTTSAPVISGMFVAGDQIQLETSSAGAVGSVVASDQCQTATPQGLVTTSEVKNPTIWYDPNSDAPFTSVVSTTLWLDYSG